MHLKRLKMKIRYGHYNKHGLPCLVVSGQVNRVIDGASFVEFRRWFKAQLAISKNDISKRDHDVSLRLAFVSKHRKF